MEDLESSVVFAGQVRLMQGLGDAAGGADPFAADPGEDVFSEASDLLPEEDDDDIFSADPDLWADAEDPSGTGETGAACICYRTDIFAEDPDPEKNGNKL